MKKTRFFLMALLLVTVFVFTSCGSKDADADGIPDDKQNSTSQDIKDGADDVKDDVEDLGDDVKDGARDAADDIENGARDAADDIKGDAGNGNNSNSVKNKAGSKGDVSKNTPDNGTKSTLQ